MNSLKKGKRFELFTAHLLSKSFGVKFMRVPMSGAFQTSHKSHNPVFSGDVFTEDEKFNRIFRVVIECKRIKSLGRKKNVLDLAVVKRWIDQCVRESRGMNTWLFFKADYKPAQVIEILNENGKVTILPPVNVVDFLKNKKNIYESEVPNT